MASLYPRLSESELDALPSRAEAKVYHWLQELEYPGLQVMHGLATQTRNDKGTWVGEIDFLLFHPQHDASQSYRGEHVATFRVAKSPSTALNKTIMTGEYA